MIRLFVLLILFCYSTVAFAIDKEKFSWKTKYHGTEDFRECIFDYDPCFIDILFDNNIPELIDTKKRLANLKQTS